MKSRKRLLFALIPLALFALLLLPGKALAKSGKYVFDEQEVLSSSEFNELESMGASYADKYHVGVYLLYTDSMTGYDESSGSGRNEFARDYYTKHDLGVGSGKDGIIFVVAVQSRKYVTVKHFNDKATDPFSNDSVDKVEKDAKSELKSNDWYEAGSSYYNNIGEHLDYFAKNGKQWKKKNLIGTVVKIAATILIPLMIAFGITRSAKNAMKTARMQTEAGNYLDPNSFNLRISTDNFVNRTMSVVPLPKNDDSDSSDSGWSDMGGGFSGSGGGDF